MSFQAQPGSSLFYDYIFVFINGLTTLYREMIQNQDCLQWFYISGIVHFKKSHTQQPRFKWNKTNFGKGS